MSLLILLIDKKHRNFYLHSAESFWYYYSWLIEPKTGTISPSSHFKTITVNSNLTVSVVPNLLSTAFTKSDRPTLVISPTQIWGLDWIHPTPTVSYIYMYNNINITLKLSDMLFIFFAGMEFWWFERNTLLAQPIIFLLFHVCI